MPRKIEENLTDLFLALVGISILSICLLKLFRYNDFSETAIGGSLIGIIYAIALSQKKNIWPLFHPVFAFLTLGTVLKILELLFSVFEYKIEIFFKDFFLGQGLASWLGLCLVFFLRNIRLTLTHKD